MKKTIKMKAGFTTDLARQKRKLERAELQAQADVRNALRRARRHAIEHANGNSDALEDLKFEMEAAIEHGMDPSIITIGGGMVGKINALLDEPESQSHAAGLLLGAADLLAGIDQADADTVAAIAAKHSTSADAEVWKLIATPVRTML